MRELKLEELNTRQKLGMCLIALVRNKDPKKVEFALDLIRNHSLGAVWVRTDTPGRDELLAKIRETADYPILIMCDAEEGMPDHLIGCHNAIGCTDNEELAYAFGKVTGVTARNLGYNVICDPILDMAPCNCVCGATVRSMGPDKYRVAKLAKAEARGFHDSGILTIAKHYPGFAGSEITIDSHMGESTSSLTKEELIENNLYPYIELIKEGLLDGIMTKHARFVNIDPDYPASLSQKLINVIREQGFDGIAITDALTMMGVVAKFGRHRSVGLAVGNGNDLALPYYSDPEREYGFMCQSYDEGLIPDERLDEAVTRVLAAQHKTLAEPKHKTLTKEDIDTFNRINTDSTFAYTDDGVPVALDREGRHLFVISTEMPIDINTRDRVIVDTMNKNWYKPFDIADKLKALYPSSGITTLSIFPSSDEVWKLLNKTVEHDDVVFITFFNSAAYIGRECLTSRVISIMEALQITNQISTIVHFGNPYVLEELPHVPRILVGTVSTDNVQHTLDILAGNAPALGIPTYDIKLK